MNKTSLIFMISSAVIGSACGGEEPAKNPSAVPSAPSGSAAPVTPAKTSEAPAPATSASAPAPAPTAAAPLPFQEMVDGAVALKLDGVPTGTFTGSRAWAPRAHSSLLNGPLSFREVQWFAFPVKKSENGLVFFENAVGNQKRMEAVPAVFALPTSTKLPAKGTVVRCAAGGDGGLAVGELATGALVVGRFDGEKDGKPRCANVLYGNSVTASDGIWTFPTKVEPGAVVDVVADGKSKLAAEVYALQGDDAWVRPIATAARQSAEAPLLRVKKADLKLMQLWLTTPPKKGDVVLAVSKDGPWEATKITEVLKDNLGYKVEGNADMRMPHQIAKK